MTGTVKEILEFVKENDVKFIRLGFCDLFGVQKNISILPSELEYAFAHGVSFDASAIPGFADVTQSDLLLFPDASTLTALPWRPGPGRVVRFYCDIRHPDGTPFFGDSRAILKRMVQRCADKGFTASIATECEFYLFQTDETGAPTKRTLDEGGYLDIAPLDQGENIRREICLCLEEMGLNPETSHHEQGPGQNEIDFQPANPLTAADHMLTFKSVVKSIAARNGLFASFLPKPLAQQSGNGMHINLSLASGGVNVFQGSAAGHTQLAESFMAGVLRRAAEMTFVLNPLVNSYERLGCFEAPQYVSWSHQNRSQLVRIPAAANNRMRMELRSPDPCANPYLALALILAAGLEGVEEGLPLPAPVNEDLFRAPQPVLQALQRLPDSLAQALALAQASAFVTECMGQRTLGRYVAGKQEEAAAQAELLKHAELFDQRFFRRM